MSAVVHAHVVHVHVCGVLTSMIISYMTGLLLGEGAPGDHHAQEEQARLLRGNAYCCILHTVAYLHTAYLLHTVAYLHTSAGRAGGCECVAYLICSRALHTLLHTGR